MRNIKTFASLFTILLLMAYSVPQKEDTKMIEGTWVYKNYFNGVYTYEKVRRFKKDEGGYKFMKDGSLKVKQNSGWCGTPPISYEIAEGTWKKVNDSLIHIEHTYWGGTISEDLHIVSLDGSEMAFKISIKK